jgi:predicted enzyme related to lactoylglutathione lyase
MMVQAWLEGAVYCRSVNKKRPLFRAIDCLRLPVRDLDAALAFYRNALGQELAWRSETAAGLRLPDGEGEIVLQTERPEPEVDLLVEAVPPAVERLVAAGGRLLSGPFEIQVGLCAVVQDPFGNVLVLLDMSKGRLITDAEGRIVGNEAPDL